MDEAELLALFRRTRDEIGGFVHDLLKTQLRP